MTPDAKLRQDVYQEGQRAAGNGQRCPYTDWRAKTWHKGFEAAKAYRKKLLNESVAPVTPACGDVWVTRKELKRWLALAEGMGGRGELYRSISDYL